MQPTATNQVDLYRTPGGRELGGGRLGGHPRSRGYHQLNQRQMTTHQALESRASNSCVSFWRSSGVIERMRSISGALSWIFALFRAASGSEAICLRKSGSAIMRPIMASKPGDRSRLGTISWTCCSVTWSAMVPSSVCAAGRRPHQYTPAPRLPSVGTALDAVFAVIGGLGVGVRQCSAHCYLLPRRRHTRETEPLTI